MDMKLENEAIRSHHPIAEDCMLGSDKNHLSDNPPKMLNFTPLWPRSAPTIHLFCFKCFNKTPFWEKRLGGTCIRQAWMLSAAILSWRTVKGASCIQVTWAYWKVLSFQCILRSFHAPKTNVANKIWKVPLLSHYSTNSPLFSLENWT